tara:strand:+ start:97 stop:537 length:441 start_codon:yes stop_codon:yes gene_type:complete
MAVITTTLTLTANKSAASTNPGPLSVALALNASDVLTVDTVTSKIVSVTDAHATLIDGSNFTPGTGGTNGGFIYMKNTTSSGTGLIYIGIEPNEAAAALEGSSEVQRLFTLKRGEFAWFPFDYTMDITIDASAATQQLEYWIFDRG